MGEVGWWRHVDDPVAWASGIPSDEIAGLATASNYRLVDFIQSNGPLGWAQFEALTTNEQDQYVSARLSALRDRIDAEVLGATDVSPESPSHSSVVSRSVSVGRHGPAGTLAEKTAGRDRTWWHYVNDPTEWANGIPDREIRDLSTASNYRLTMFAESMGPLSWDELRALSGTEQENYMTTRLSALRARIDAHVLGGQHLHLHSRELVPLATTPPVIRPPVRYQRGDPEVVSGPPTERLSADIHDPVRHRWGDRNDSSAAGVIAPSTKGRTRAASRGWTKLRRAIALVALLAIPALLLSGGFFAWVSTAYPGGFEEWQQDSQSPAPMGDLDVSALLQSSLVTIVTDQWHGTASFQGSGFLFEDQTSLVTAAHVIPDAVTRIAVTDRAGSPHPAELLAVDRTNDVAFLRVRGLSGIPLQPSTRRLFVGDRAFVGGNPRDAAPGTVSKVSITSLDASETVEGNQRRHLLLMSGGYVDHGMSGGPLVDAWGHLLGVFIAGQSDSTHGAAAQINAVAGSVDYWRNRQPMYVGPPLIRANGSQLLLPISAFGNRAATQKSPNEISYDVGNFGLSFISGDLWVATYPSIADATAQVAKCEADLMKGFSGATSSAQNIGDGGKFISAISSSSADLIGLCWSSRNAVAILWVLEQNYDESKFFQQIVNEQQKAFDDAT